MSCIFLLQLVRKDMDVMNARDYPTLQLDTT